jgi:hypothetical protein
LPKEKRMTEPNDPFPLNVTEPEPWDRAGAPPALPFMIQEAAIEELLGKEPGPLLAADASADLGADFSGPAPAPSAAAHEPMAAPPEPAALVEEFKPTDAEWENVKESLLPHPDAVSLEEKQHPAYKPEFLERDAQGRDGGGDWNEVETAKPGTGPFTSQ